MLVGVVTFRQRARPSLASIAVLLATGFGAVVLCLVDDPLCACTSWEKVIAVLRLASVPSGRLLIAVLCSQARVAVRLQ